ncbi:MAG: hypothetical protein R3B95_06475 [Nitrospirales bacterium]|nr:hypothetical protein [Nitrospirales bacterium]
MNVKISQPTQPQDHTKGPASETEAGPSDTKEIIYLASGLLILVLGIGGLLMYSEEAPLPATASQGIDTTQMASAFTSSEQEPASFEPLALSQDSAEEPVINAITRSAEREPTNRWKRQMCILPLTSGACPIKPGQPQNPNGEQAGRMERHHSHRGTYRCSGAGCL